MIDGRTAVDAAAGVGTIFTTLAVYAGQIAPILACISTAMAIGWFSIRYYHLIRFGRDIPRGE